MLANRMRENQLAHMSLDEELCGTGTSWLCATTGSYSGKIQKTNKKSLKAKGKGKANGKGKDKQVYIPKPKNPKPSAKEHPAKDDTCHHCKEGFREARKLKQGALYLYVANGVRVQVEAIGSYDLVLPNGLVICLDNYFGISVSKNNVFYFNVIPSNGIYEIDMHDLVPNVNSIYNVSTKRAKHNLDSTYLWHCRLAHISKKHIEKLQQEGLLKSTDDESFDQCVSCLSGKMTRKSFPHRPKRVTDLLGIIHTGVCGPLRHVARQGASYFITFTDDYSRYGNIYLLKHKHEVFETFKVFKNEVENQLGKTIKALRSDRGGKYISQEFKDYLKACGIVQQLTPPYTPQHNRVSERRNRTLLDMVRSMMNLTTLPLSFWDYALESATRILNMVPTKKVDKTPYELCGRAMDLEEIQDEDTSPSEITSKIPMEVEGFEPPQEEVILIDAMNEEIQSMIDNMVWVLVDLPPGSKGLYSTLWVDYEEMFSPVADIRAIRILISIAAFYDYEIWQMDVKTAFLNGYLDEDIYMVQPEGFVDPNHPRKNPGELHWTAMKNILKYLRNTKDMFLVYGGNLEAELRVDCYCDAGIETDRDNTKSQTGYVFILNGGVVDWKSSKQRLDIVPTINEPIRMFYDNSAAFHFANEPGVQKGARHYHRRYHYVRESIALGKIRFLKVHTDDNLDDPFTNALPKGKLTQYASSMRLRLASSFI
ncbi:retrotransposon protein, putative, ty1-copia subclass [Tanacetum coccineum]